MTEQATRVVPAGWYDDPASPDRVRWWNGVMWTDHVSIKPGRAPQVPVAADPVAANRALEAQFGIGTAEVAQQAAVRYQPAQAATATRTATVASWLVAISPALTAIAVVIAAWLYNYVLPNPLVLLVAGIPYLVTLLFAFRDSRTLAERGLEAPSGAWALLTGLVYLVIRRVKVAGRGVLAACIVLTAIAVAIPAAAWATGGARPVLTALSIQQQLAAELKDSGRATAVSCPAIIDSVEIDTAYECTVTRSDGRPARVTVVIDGPDGEFSWAFNTH